jgi:hypothetical protein
MSIFVQALEDRVLMSVTAATLTADATAVLAQITATKTSFATLKASDASFRAGIASQIKLLDTKTNRAANSKLVAALNRNSSVNYAKINSADNALLAAAKSDALAGEAAGKLFLLHPTKTAYQTKVTKEIAILNALSTKLTALETAVANASTTGATVYTEVVTANPTLAGAFATGEATGQTNVLAFSNNAALVITDTTQLATDLGFPSGPLATLTGATLFRGDSTGTNQDTGGTVADHGAWTTGLDVQNVPGNYAAELFISRVANPTSADFLTPGQLSASLSAGANTFYFFANGDDLLGGSATFGLNLFINSASSTTPALSGYTIPGTGQTLTADSSSTTPNIALAITPGAGTLSTSTTGATVALTSFIVQGVSGQGSTVDLVDSTNTTPFTPPAHPDGVPDTYGTFTITVTPSTISG